MKANSQRLYYLDWLRVLAMLAVFFYHADRFFDFYGWHVKNPETNLLSSIHVALFGLWLMPLFFVLSGASSFLSLQVRSTGQFVKERFTRILIPLLILGYWVISPPQSYLDRLTNNKFEGSFFDFLPYYTQGFDVFGGNFPWHGFHLWYLLYLFILSLLLLPFFIKVGKSGKSILSRLSRIFEPKGMLLVLPLPIVAVRVMVDVLGMGDIRATGGWTLFAYLFYLAFGYMIFSNNTLLQSIYRLRTPLTVLSIVLSIVYIGFRFFSDIEISEKTPNLYLLATFIRVYASMAWILAFVGWSEKYLNFSNSHLKYANEAVLPFYILHQLVLLLIGYLVVQWSIPVFVKFLIIAFLSFFTIMFFYEFVIRRFIVFRFLFGMKLKTVRK